jgi:hypothetical protein
MKRVALMIFPVLICGMVFTLIGCEKDTPEEVPKLYLGKWKLMSVNFAWTKYANSLTSPILDLSEGDVMYDFFSDGYMYVLGEMPELDLDSNTERDCLELYLRHGYIETGGYKYAVTFPWNNGWIQWSFKVGDKDYGLFVSEDKSIMRISKSFPYNEVPLMISTRTSSDAPPSAWLEVLLEKVEE